MRDSQNAFRQKIGDKNMKTATIERAIFLSPIFLSKQRAGVMQKIGAVHEQVPVEFGHVKPRLQLVSYRLTGRAPAQRPGTRG